jgi:hypothetical protein
VAKSKDIPDIRATESSTTDRGGKKETKDAKGTKSWAAGMKSAITGASKSK